MCQVLTLLNQSNGARPPTSSLHAERVLATCEAAARFRFYALLRGLADIYDAVESRQVILVFRWGLAINPPTVYALCHESGGD